MIDSVSMFSDMALLETQEGAGTTQGESPSEIEDAARQFEAMLLQIVIKEMRKTVPEGMFASSGGDIFQELFDQELSNEMLGNGEGLGLAQSLAGGQSRIPQSSPNLPLGLQAYASQGETRLPGDRVYPVQGRVSSVFGSRRDPIEGSHRHHNGLDITAPEGRPFTPFETGGVLSLVRGEATATWSLWTTATDSRPATLTVRTMWKKASGYKPETPSRPSDPPVDPPALTSIWRPEKRAKQSILPTFWLVGQKPKGSRTQSDGPSERKIFRVR